MLKLYEDIKVVLSKKNPILISNVDKVNNDEYVLDLFIKKNKDIINFTFSYYIEKYGDATDLYEIYDTQNFSTLEDCFEYMQMKYREYQPYLSELLSSNFKKYIK